MVVISILCLIDAKRGTFVVQKAYQNKLVLSKDKKSTKLHIGYKRKNKAEHAVQSNAAGKNL